MVDWSTHHVFRRLPLDDEPSAFGTYTASDVATERSEPSLIPMATMDAMGGVWMESREEIMRRNGGIGSLS